MAISSKIDLDFSWGNVFSHFIFPFAELTEVHAKPGIYTWQVVPDNFTELKSVVDFFQQSKLRAKVKGNLRLSYSGYLMKDISTLNCDQGDHFDIFRNIMMAVSYPIYIGISCNLNIRLNTHKNMFLECLQKTVSSNMLFSENTQEESLIDSEIESRYFAKRLFDAWPQDMSCDRLYVKYCIPIECLKCKEDISNCARNCSHNIRSILLECEKFTNSVFNPIFGRR